MFLADVTKSELDKSVSLTLCGLPLAQSQMDLFLDTLCAKTTKGHHLNQSGEAMSRVTASVMFFFTGTLQLIFAGTGVLKIDSFLTVLGSP